MAQDSNNSVCAVVVTHNRLAMLQECVGALRRQTHLLDAVIVVDNDSTDGTWIWLNEQEDLHIVQQANLGGAGGFHTGIQAAFQRGHDWVWCMDDDGYPEPDCLARLLAVECDNLWFRAPVVLRRDDPTQLAFVVRAADGEMLQTSNQFNAAAQNGLVWGVACPFNGVLIHRQIIESIGLPVAGMFLWGDETEYCLRAMQAGYRIATAANAYFYHPRERMVEHYFKFFGREFCVMSVDRALRDYLVIRNRAYILRRYFGLAMAVKHIGRHVLFHAKLGGWRGIRLALGAGCAGLRGDWRGHQRYLSEGLRRSPAPVRATGSR